MISSPKPLALVSMALSPYEFHLTGSRFFNPFTVSSSDWDFFTVNTPEIQEFLRSIGFLRTSGLKKYQDANVVFIHQDNVHIQLVDDVETKIAAQNLLIPFLRHLPKNVHSTMWNAALIEVTTRKDKTDEVR